MRFVAEGTRPPSGKDGAPAAKQLSPPRLGVVPTSESSARGGSMTSKRRRLQRRVDRIVLVLFRLYFSPPTAGRTTKDKEKEERSNERRAFRECPLPRGLRRSRTTRRVVPTSNGQGADGMRVPFGSAAWFVQTSGLFFLNIRFAYAAAVSSFQILRRSLLIARRDLRVTGGFLHFQLKSFP